MDDTGAEDVIKPLLICYVINAFLSELYIVEVKIRRDLGREAKRRLRQV